MTRRQGLVIVYTGDGKGKTTAALGIALRAVGSGMKVLMVQFIKGAWRTGELDAATRFPELLQIRPMGEGFTWDTKNPERDREKARQCWEYGKSEALSGKWDIVIFDEINYVVSYDYLPADLVVEFLQNKPPELHIILTGRDAHPKITELADLVTEMKEIKHPFKKGISAQRGIDF